MNVSRKSEVAPLISRYGIPAATRDHRETREKKLAVYFILTSTLFERIAFYALNTTLFTTLQLAEPFHWDRQHSQIALFIFSGISYISTLIFAIISDAKVGTARTIIMGFTLYLIGYTLITITASGSTFLCRFDSTDHWNATVTGEQKCAPAILSTLTFTALGAGAVKSNLVVFGGEQIQKSKLTSRYFDKYAVAVNIGSTIAILIIPFIKDHISVKYYFIPYLIATSMLLIATVLFLIGWKYYIHVTPYETVVAKCIPVVFNAFQSWYKFKRNKHLMDNRNINSSQSEILDTSDTYSLPEIEESIRICEEPSSFLDYAKVPNGKFHDRIVDDVKSLRGAFAVFGLLIPYWFIYNQSDSTFQSQGEHMRGSNPTHIVSWMIMGDPITVVLGILIFNIFIYKYLEGRSRETIIVTKFVIGMYFSLFTMCIAGIVEIFRQDECHESKISDLSLFVQLPQNIFMGFSQLFAMVASYEYAYFSAPLSGQSLFMSLHFCSIGIPSLIGTVYSYILPVSSALDFSCPKTDKSWMLYVYYFILAGIQLVFILIFTGCQRKFRIVKLNRQQMETSQFI